MKELRDALDHFMRFIHKKQSKKKNFTKEEQKTCIGNLDKSVNHIYRATFDALDGTILSLKDLINEELKNYQFDIIIKVLPEYPEIKIDLNRLIQVFADMRARKDINEETIQLLNEYIASVDRMKNVYDKILHARSALNEAVRGSKREKRLTFWRGVGIGLIVAIIMLLINLALGTLEFSNTSTTQQPVPTEIVPSK